MSELQLLVTLLIPSLFVFGMMVTLYIVADDLLFKRKSSFYIARVGWMVMMFICIPLISQIYKVIS